MDEWMNATLDN